MKVTLEKTLLVLGFLFFILVSISLGVEPVFLITVLIWFSFFLYSFLGAKKHIMLLAFLLVFFIFLLGRDFLQQYFSYKVEIFEDEVQNHAWNSYSLSLLIIGFSYLFFQWQNQRKGKDMLTGQDEGNLGNSSYTIMVRKLSLFIYYLSWFFAIASKIIMSRFAFSRGFTDLYTDYSDYVSGNFFLFMINKIELVMPVAFCIFLSTVPSKKQFKVPCVLYLIYLLISLGSGQRSPAMLGLFFLLIYLAYRHERNPEEKWLNRHLIFFGILSLPILLASMSFYTTLREGGNITTLSISKGVMDFFYDQGVSTNVVKRAYMLEAHIPNQIYTLEFLHSGILARLLGIPVYHGNSVAHALFGGSFTHTIGYLVMGGAYFSGRGTGSSYIAELYQDFHLWGILFGNLLYGWLIYRIDCLRKNKSIFSRSILLLIIMQILWAPRGSFSYFISQNFIPTTILIYVAIFGFSEIWCRYRDRRGGHYAKR